REVDGVAGIGHVPAGLGQEGQEQQRSRQPQPHELPGTAIRGRSVQVGRLGGRGPDRAGRPQSRLRTTRAGFPAARTPGGMSPVTTAPYPMTDPSPIRTPGRIAAPRATQTFRSMITGALRTGAWGLVRRSWAMLCMSVSSTWAR